MMKALSGILFLFLFGVGTMAQNPVTPSQALEKNLRASGEYFKWSAGQSKVKGSPYLTEEFHPGSIHWNRVWNEGIPLRYNIYEGTFEARLESGVVVINPLRNNIDTIKHREEVFVKQYLDLGKEKLVAYMPLLGGQNGYALYKQYRIKITEAVTDTDLYNEAKPAEFKKENPLYYVFRDMEHWTVRGSKSLAEVFQIDAKKVKSYLKENKYKLSNEEQLLESVLYFSNWNLSPENKSD